MDEIKTSYDSLYKAKEELNKLESELLNNRVMLRNDEVYDTYHAITIKKKRILLFINDVIFIFGVSSLIILAYVGLAYDYFHYFKDIDYNLLSILSNNILGAKYFAIFSYLYSSKLVFETLHLSLSSVSKYLKKDVELFIKNHPSIKLDSIELFQKYIKEENIQIEKDIYELRLGLKDYEEYISSYKEEALENVMKKADIDAEINLDYELKKLKLQYKDDKHE